MKQGKFLVLFLAGLSLLLISATRIVTPLVDTQVSAISTTVSEQQINQIPVNTNSAGSLIKLAPNISTLPVPSGNVITNAAPYLSDDGDVDFLLRTQAGTLPKFFYCEGTNDCSPLNIGGLASLGPSLSYGATGNTGIVNLIAKSGSSVYSQGNAFDPANNRFLGPRFPMFSVPEKLFPAGVLSSVGVSADASASFEVANFNVPTAPQGYFLFRTNNTSGRPAGPIVRFTMPPERVFSSATLSGPIVNSSGDRRYFAYREFQNFGQPNATSQVKIQVLDANTFQFIGTPKVFTPVVRSVYPQQEVPQSVVIEQGALYLAYTQYNPTCNKNLINIRAINPDGSPKGGPKLLTTCGQAGPTLYGYEALSSIRLRF